MQFRHKEHYYEPTEGTITAGAVDIKLYRPVIPKQGYFWYPCLGHMVEHMVEIDTWLK